ncbi:thermopsin [Sulfurisphaera ohwakuensis]|uniref:thermopsin n=1 Tax=Sulfurisphaera ohwakuensis TaxID=69656 RepID=UPI0036F3C16C
MSLTPPRIIFFMILSLSLTPLYLTNAQSSGAIQLQHGYYLYYNITVYDGQFIHVQLKASAPVTLMVMNEQQFNEFSQGHGSSSLYATVTQSLNEDFNPPEGGKYFVVVYNNVTSSTVNVYLKVNALPIIPLIYHSSLPAPIGLGFYGVINESGRIEGFAIPYQEAIGYATIYSILAYNATPPNGTNSWGAGLQMNAILQVNTTYGTYAYWLQNTVGFVTNQRTYQIGDNVWNYTSNESILSNTSITGEGYVTRLNNGNEYYGYVGTQGNYSLPFSVILYTKLDSITPNSVTVSFGYNLGSGIVWYDNVTIHQPGVISAVLLVNPFNTTPNGNLYDLDLDFAGQGNGEHTYFKEMNASLGLQIVLLNGTVITPLSLYTFGITGEEADNLKVIDVNGTVFVVTGNNTFWKQVSVEELPKLYFQQNTSTLSSSSSSTNNAIIGLIAFFIFIVIVSLTIYRAVKKLRHYRATRRYRRIKKYRRNYNT